VCLVFQAASQAANPANSQGHPAANRDLERLTCPIPCLVFPAPQDKQPRASQAAAASRTVRVKTGPEQVVSQHGKPPLKMAAQRVSLASLEVAQANLVKAGCRAAPRETTAQLKAPAELVAAAMKSPGNLACRAAQTVMVMAAGQPVIRSPA
jgi:hypothetical protein